jgi:RNA polymerase sigma factor (sigma-70 family)
MHWQMLRQGSEAALFALYQHHYPLLLAFGRQQGFEVEACKDQVQQVFLELWDKRNDLPAVEKVTAYLLTYFKRKLLRNNQQRVQRQLLHKANFAAQENMEDFWEKMLALETQALQQKKLSEMIDQLPERQQQLLRLRFFEGLSYEAIQVATGLTVRTVYNKIHEAIKRLKDCF